MIKVLMLTTNSSLMDGINRHILTIAPALNQRPEIEVGVCTVNPYGELNEALERGGVQTFSLDAHNGHDWHIAKRYYRIVKSFNPDIVHCHVMAMMERIISSICFRNKKYIATVHGIRDKVRHRTIKTRIESILYKIFNLKLSAICYISKGVYNALANDARNTQISEIIYNPLDFDSICAGTHKLHHIIGIQNNDQIIGTSCRIAKVKNPELFTEIMCKILTRIGSAHAVIIGDGDSELKKSCESIVEQYDVRTRFHWLGYRSDAPELIKDLSCFVMTSISEGLPTSLLECMAARTPFAFLEGAGGLKDMAEFNETEGPFAIYGTHDNIDKFINDIINLLNNECKAKEYAERAYQVGKRYFDINVIVGKLASLYKKVVLK